MVSTEQCSGSSVGIKALRLGSRDRRPCQHSCPAGVSFSAAPNVNVTTDLSLRQPGTRGHKGVSPARAGEALSGALAHHNLSLWTCTC